MRRYFSLALSLMLLAGCSFTDEGTGSGTIEAMAQIDYNFMADSYVARLLLLKEEQPLSAAEAIIDDGQTEFRLTEDSNSEYNYSMEISGYHRTVVLDVSKDNDKFQVSLLGPAHGIIVAPEQNGIITYDKNKDLTVEWRADDGIAADMVTVSFANADVGQTINEDNGQLAFPMKDLKPGPEKITVKRCNSTNIAGAARGSIFTMCYEVSNFFQLSAK